MALELEVVLVVLPDVVVLEAATEVQVVAEAVQVQHARSSSHCVSMKCVALEVAVVVVLQALWRLDVWADAVLARQMASLSPCLTREGTHH